MRRFFLLAAALFLVYGFLLIFGIHYLFVFNPDDIIEHTSIIAKLYGAGFIVAGTVGAVAGIERTYLWQAVGLTALAGVSSLWLVFTFVTMVYSQGEVSRFLLWTFITYILYTVSPYLHITVDEEKHIHALIDSMERTTHEIERRTGTRAGEQHTHKRSTDD